MQQNIHIVSKLSKIDMRNKVSQVKEVIYFARNDFRNVLKYYDY